MKDKKLWKELIRLLSAVAHPTKATLAQTCMRVFFSRSVSDTIFVTISLPNRRGPQFEKHGTRAITIIPQGG
jgi:hypothetical protein